MCCRLLRRSSQPSDVRPALLLALCLTGCGAATVPLVSAALGFGASAFKLDVALLQWWEGQRAATLPTELPPLPDPTVTVLP